jgi:hypothetical protein
MLAPSEAAKKREEIPFSRVNIRIEYNATDEDVGVQVLLDGEPWKRVRMFNPRERILLDIVSQGSLRQQGLTELFFESSEPSLAEVTLEQFLRRFPAGEYEFEGLTLEGVELEGEARLTHAIPAGAEIVSPVSPTDDPPLVDPGNALFEWIPVTETIAGDPVEIVGYQLIVEQPEPLRVLSLDLPATVTSVVVPPEFFLLPDTLHKFEVLAIERSGNQTIISGEFVTPN